MTMLTWSPTFTSDCKEESRATWTWRARSVTDITACPGATVAPRLGVTPVTRSAPGWKTTEPTGSWPLGERPTASCSRNTAASVAAVKSSPDSPSAVPERIKVGVELGHILARGHTGSEGTPGRDRPIKQHDRLATDREQLFAPAHDLANGWELRVGRALTSHIGLLLVGRQGGLVLRQSEPGSSELGCRLLGRLAVLDLGCADIALGRT